MLIMTNYWRKLHKEEVYNSYSPSDIRMIKLRAGIRLVRFVGRTDIRELHIKL
jgi:hypothetical protein